MDGPGGNHEPWWAGRARYWKTTLLATSLTFAILATIFYALRVYASSKSQRIVRPDDIFMGLAVVLMWAETAAVLLSESAPRLGAGERTGVLRLLTGG